MARGSLSWYRLHLRNNATSSSAVNSEKYASRRTSGAFRASHLNTDKNLIVRVAPTPTYPSSPSSLGPTTLSPTCASDISRPSNLAGSNIVTSTASGTTLILRGSTPHRSKTSALHLVGTHTSSILLHRATCSRSSLSVSNMVRPMTLTACRRPYPSGGHRAVSYLAGAHAPGSEWHTMTESRARGCRAVSIESSSRA